MKKAILLTLLISFLSNAQVEEDLRIYKQSFEDYFGITVNTKITYGDFIGSDENTIAVSVRGENTVIVNETKFKALPYFTKYWVMYHEIIHAQLDVRHVKKGLMQAKTPRNIGIAVFKKARKEFKESL